MKALTYVLAGALALSGCKKLSEKALETATGGKMKIDGDKIEMTGDDGQKVTIAGGKAVVKGPDGKEATVIADDKGGIKFEANDGSKAVIGSQELPKDFPLALIDGFKVATSVNTEQNEQKVYSVTATGKADAAAVGAFYEKAFKDKGLAVTKSEQTIGDAKMVLLAGKGEKVDATAQVTKGADGDATLMLSWSQKK